MCIVAQHIAHPLVAGEVMGSNLRRHRVITTLNMVPNAAMSGARHR